MTDSEQLAFVTDVLEVLDGDSDHGDINSAVFTMVRDRQILFMVNANDLFYWACADGEYITPDNLPLLKQSIQDVRTALGVATQPDLRSGSTPETHKLWEQWYNAGSLGATLFAARVRGMRPQQPCYKAYPATLHPLFDACGPVRDRKDEG